MISHPDLIIRSMHLHNDLYLVQYRETVDKNSPPVELLRPEGAPHAWFADFGWTGAGVAGLPAFDSNWTLTQGDKLAPGASEWDELNTQHTRLSHAQALIETAEGALGLLESDDSGVHGGLGRAQHLLAQQEHLDPEFKAVAEVLASALAQVDDARHSLHTYLRRADLDQRFPGFLDAILGSALSAAVEVESSEAARAAAGAPAPDWE